VARGRGPAAAPAGGLAAVPIIAEDACDRVHSGEAMMRRKTRSLPLRVAAAAAAASAAAAAWTACALADAPGSLLHLPWAGAPPPGAAWAAAGAAGGDPEAAAGFGVADRLSAAAAHRPGGRSGVDLSAAGAGPLRRTPGLAAGARGLGGGAEAAWALLHVRPGAIEAGIGALAADGRVAPFLGAGWRVPRTGVEVLAGAGDGRAAAGVRWRVVPWLVLSASLDDDGRAGLRAVVAGRPSDVLRGRDGRAWTPAAVSAIGPDGGPAEGADALAAVLASDPDVSGLVRGVRLEGADAVVAADAGAAAFGAREAGRIARAVASAAPPATRRIVVAASAGTLRGTAVEMLRADLDRAGRNMGSAEEVRRTARLLPLAAAEPVPRPERTWTDLLPGSAPTSIVLAAAADPAGRRRAWIDLETPAALPAGFSADAVLRLNAAATPPGPAETPGPGGRGELLHASAAAGVARLALSWTGSAADGLHMRASAGLLDELHQGWGGEMLWRPHGARWAFGAEGYSARRRAPGLDGAVLDLPAVATGHLAAYRALPGPDLDAALRVGRFAAGDVGIESALIRRLAPGIRAELSSVLSAGAGGAGPTAAASLRLVVGLGALPRVGARVRAEASVRPVGAERGRRIDAPSPLHALTQPVSAAEIDRRWSELLR
jgi:hypothetical protein